MSRILLLVVLSCVFVAVTEGHARFKCPKARDWNDASGKHIVFDNTGNKVGPCGPFSGKFGMGGVTQLTPNSWQTLTVEESVSHKGSPFRIAILDETETARVLLLDHIPHWDAAAPIPYVEATYVPYHFNVYIPDVLCEKCSIQMVYFMTDKSIKCGIPTCTYHANDSACSGHTDSSPACFGAPNNTPCKEANTCFSNYHSCIDVTIAGTIPIEKANFEQPADWPNRNMTSGQYADEAVTWANGFPSGYPSTYTTMQGQDLC